MSYQVYFGDLTEENQALILTLLRLKRDILRRSSVGAIATHRSAGPAGVGTGSDLSVAEIARCLRPGGVAVLVTKSLDSYAELDHLVQAANLDPDAVYWGTRLACLEMVRSGTTRFFDMYWHATDDVMNAPFDRPVTKIRLVSTQRSASSWSSRSPNG